MSRLRRRGDTDGEGGGGGGKSPTRRGGGGDGGGRRGGNHNNSNNANGGTNNSVNYKKQKMIDFDRNDDIIDSDQEDDDDERRLDRNKNKKRFDDNDDDDDHDIEEEETLDAKKVRLAREYLRKLEAGKDDDDTSTGRDSDSQDGSEDDDDDDDDNDETKHDRIGARLQRDRLKREGMLEVEVADKVFVGLERMRNSLPIRKAQHDEMDDLVSGQSNVIDNKQQAQDWVDAGHIKLLRGHDLTPTCVALQANGERAISASKDHSILLWDIHEERKSHTLCPSWKKSNDSSSSRTMGEILSVACSDDGRYAAVGRRDATVCLYDIRLGRNTKPIGLAKTFLGHKGPITSLCFRTQSLQLFSASDDRCIRHYSINEMMYMETLYGHQFGVTGIDCHRKERPISVGRDRTARAWKIAEDTHLIFRGGAKVASADSIRVMKEDWFLSGHEDGHLGLWMTEKKRAVVSVDYAHGVDDAGVGRAIGAIGALRGSDLAVTGSHDGYLRLWKVMMGQTLDSRGMEPLDSIPLHGYVNSVAVGPKARFCVVAVGQEPRLGRWNRIPGAKNRFGIVRLRSDEEINADIDDKQHGLDEGPVEVDRRDNDGDDDSSDGE
jgi:ribosomal RNA-processing protein 9